MNLKMTPQKKKAFLAALAETCSIRLACEAADISRQTAYAWRAADEKFAAGWVRAKDYAADVLEDEAVRRAVEGYDKPVFFEGVEVGVTRVYSDKLLTLLLQAARPDKYHMGKFKPADFEVIIRSLDPDKQKALKDALANFDELLDEAALDKADQQSRETKVKELV